MYDYCVIGSGIVGLSTAYNLQRKYPNSQILVLEKEDSYGLHQTSHNSGVIHAGLYYKPGSLKSELCREGLQSTIRFCDENSIKYKNCGKLIVASDDIEKKRLINLFNTARKVNKKIELISSTNLSIIEPNIIGKLAVFSPETSIVNFRDISKKLKSLVKYSCEIIYESEVRDIKERKDYVYISTDNGSYKTKKLIVCAGLQSDRIARIAGVRTDSKIVPFKGEYFRLSSSKNNIVDHLIYPVPDPDLPFLGIHLTKMIDGGVTIGPNAVLSFAREGYKKFSFNYKDARSAITFPGLWRLLWKNRKYITREIFGSLSKKYFLDECRKYCPSLKLDDLETYSCGIRAQLVSNKGEAIHDFVIKKTSRMVHVLNAPSPAATSALPIGEKIISELEKN